MREWEDSKGMPGYRKAARRTWPKLHLTPKMLGNCGLDHGVESVLPGMPGLNCDVGRGLSQCVREGLPHCCECVLPSSVY